jgi:hypothetical protein
MIKPAVRGPIPGPSRAEETAAWGASCGEKLVRSRPFFEPSESLRRLESSGLPGLKSLAVGFQSSSFIHAISFTDSGLRN